MASSSPSTSVNESAHVYLLRLLNNTDKETLKLLDPANVFQNYVQRTASREGNTSKGDVDEDIQLPAGVDTQAVMESSEDESEDDAVFRQRQLLKERKERMQSKSAIGRPAKFHASSPTPTTKSAPSRLEKRPTVGRFANIPEHLMGRASPTRSQSTGRNSAELSREDERGLRNTISNISIISHRFMSNTPSATRKLSFTTPKQYLEYLATLGHKYTEVGKQHWRPQNVHADTCARPCTSHGPVPDPQTRCQLCWETPLIAAARRTSKVRNNGPKASSSSQTTSDGAPIYEDPETPITKDFEPYVDDSVTRYLYNLRKYDQNPDAYRCGKPLLGPANGLPKLQTSAHDENTILRRMGTQGVRHTAERGMSNSEIKMRMNIMNLEAEQGRKWRKTQRPATVAAQKRRTTANKKILTVEEMDKVGEEEMKQLTMKRAAAFFEVMSEYSQDKDIQDLRKTAPVPVNKLGSGIVQGLPNLYRRDRLPVVTL